MNPVEIYESLFQFESLRDQKNQGYPIHKKLIFDEDHISDIYDWIIENFKFPEGSRILDAGCGVGYGSMKLAKYNNLIVTGISISESEVNKATNNAKLNGLDDRLKFITSDFDNAPNQEYDYIIAVESLKHSLNLNKSLDSLKNKLAYNGRFIIIEDFYQTKKITSEGSQLMKDWSLVDLYRKEDFEQTIEMTNYVDLTQFMPYKNKISLKLRSMFFRLMSWFPSSKNKEVYIIFRGGILLDLLFARQLMKYGVFIYHKIKINA